MRRDGTAKPALTRAQKIVQRTKVGGALAVVVAAVLWSASTAYGHVITLLFATGLTGWSTLEASRMGLLGSARAVQGAAATIFLMAVLFATGPLSTGDDLPPAPLQMLLGALIVALPGVSFAGIGGRADAEGEEGAQIAMPGVQIIPLLCLPLFFLVSLRAYGGAAALASVVALAKLGDVAGYYVGNALGKRHPFPRLSPGKTVAGCVGSLVAGTAAGAGFSAAGWLGDPRFGLLSGLVLGALVNVAAQAGDLLESALKRRAGVKDSGTTFGPSGGVLDLVDSFLLAAPLAATIGPLLFWWGTTAPPQ